MNYDELDLWVDRLDELKPFDGILTQAIVEAVGNPSISVNTPKGKITRKAAEDLVFERAANQAAVKAYLRPVLRGKASDYGAESWRRRDEGELRGDAQLS